jgi:hypothetical protein
VPESRLASPPFARISPGTEPQGRCEGHDFRHTQASALALVPDGHGDLDVLDNDPGVSLPGRRCDVLYPQRPPAGTGGQDGSEAVNA